MNFSRGRYRRQEDETDATFVIDGRDNSPILPKNVDAIYMKTNDMANPLLNAIGELIKQEIKQDESRVLLYAEVEEGALSVALFVERGNHIDYVAPSWDKNYDILFDLWHLQAANRWSEIEYLLERDTFKVRFAYPEEIDPEEDPFDRRDRTVQRYFGEKPIVYPPWDDSLPTYDL